MEGFAVGYEAGHVFTVGVRGCGFSGLGEDAHVIFFSEDEVAEDGAVFCAEAAAESPVADGDPFNEHLFQSALRLYILDEFVMELSEGGRVLTGFFVIKHYFFGPKAVGDSVAGRGALAFICSGAC